MTSDSSDNNSEVSVIIPNRPDQGKGNDEPRGPPSDADGDQQMLNVVQESREESVRDGSYGAGNSVQGDSVAKIKASDEMQLEGAKTTTESDNVESARKSQQNWIRRFSREAPDLSNLDKYYPNMPPHFRKSVIVSNISPKLTILQLKTFFSFCGKIERIGLSNGNFIGYSVLNASDFFAEDSPLNESKVEIHYFTEHAANTACLLDQTQLLGSYLKIIKKSERQLHPLSELDSYRLVGDETLRDDAMEDVDANVLGVGSTGEVQGEEPPIDFTTFVSLIKEHDLNVRRVKYTDYSHSQAESLHFSLYVGNLHGMITEEEFVAIMRNCGPIVNYQLAGDPTHPTRFGFVQYMHREDRELALKLLNGLNFMGYPLKVNACNKPISTPHIMVSKDELRAFSNATSKLQEKMKMYYKNQDRGRSPPIGRNLSPPPRHSSASRMSPGAPSRRSPPPPSRRSPGPGRDSQTSYSYPYRSDQGPVNPMGGRVHGERSDRWQSTSSGYSSYNTSHSSYSTHASHSGHQSNPPGHTYRSGPQSYKHGRPTDVPPTSAPRRPEGRDRHGRDGNSDDYHDSDSYRRGERYEGGSRRRSDGYETNSRMRNDYREHSAQRARGPYDSRQQGSEYDPRYHREKSQHSESRSLPQKRRERGDYDHDSKRPRL